MGFEEIRRNPLLLTDSYSLAHQAFKLTTDYESSHLYNRKEGMILFGFNELVATFLSGVRVSHAMVDEAVIKAQEFNLVFPEALFRRVVDELDGRIPLHVQALPEGTYCPPGTPFAQITNTVSGFASLVTWWEAIFLHGHFASACATEAMNMRLYLEDLRAKHSYDQDFLMRFHSFGFRGHRSLEDAYWAGQAWSLFLQGSDDFHIAGHEEQCPLTGIPALAHLVVQQFDRETDCFIRAIDVAADQKSQAVSLVIDTYDAYNVINTNVVSLAQHARSRGLKKLIFRPDSGDTWKQAVDIYDVALRNNVTDMVGVIIGEGMSLSEVRKADHFMVKNNVPLNFVSYGIGAGFYKHIDRDTLGWAMKTCQSNGLARMKFSENPLKRSIPGRVAVLQDYLDEFIVIQEDELQDYADEDLPINMYDDVYCLCRVYCNIRSLVIGHDIKNARKVAREEMMKTGRRSQVFIRTSPKTKDLVRAFAAKYIA